MDNTQSTGFKMKQRFGFGCIDLGRALVQNFADIYLSSFLLTVALLPAAAVSLMFLLCKIIDAVTDIVIGILVDRTSTKIGRARPWIYAGALIFAVGIILLFRAPDLDSNTARMAYAYAGYIIYTLGLTMCNIPEGTLMATLSTDPQERTIFGSIRGLISTVTVSGLGMIVAGAVMFLGDGVAESLMGYSRFAMILALICIIVFYVGNSAVKEVQIPQKKEQEKFQLKVFLKNMGAFFTTKNFVCEMVFCFGNLIYTVAVTSTLIYYCNYVLGGRYDLVGVGMTALSVAGFFTPLTAPYLTKKIPKGKLTVLGCVIAIVGISSRFLATTNTIWIPIGMAIAGIGMGYINCMIQATQPDIVDELTVKTRSMNAGLIMSLFSLGCQIGSGVSNSLITGILAIGGFDGAAEVQSASAITAVNIVFGGVPILGFILIIISMSIYDLDKKYPQIRRELDSMDLNAGQGEQSLI